LQAVNRVDWNTPQGGNLMSATAIRESESNSSFANTPVNVGQLERVASAGVGVGLVLAGLQGGLGRLLILGSAGAALIYRGWTGHCHLYEALGIQTAEVQPVGVTAQAGVRVNYQARIERSPAEVYAFWRELENLPRFMDHLRSVERSDGTSHWVANAILGATVEWDARIITERENEVIAWESLPGSGVETAGSVHFEPAEDGLATNVKVSLKYNPPLGKAGIALAAFLGEDAETKIRANLDQLKHLLENDAVGEPQSTQQAAWDG
jgi:uncharacterized membrane protein